MLFKQNFKLYTFFENKYFLLLFLLVWWKLYLFNKYNIKIFQLHNKYNNKYWGLSKIFINFENFLFLREL